MLYNRALLLSHLRGRQSFLFVGRTSCYQTVILAQPFVLIHGLRSYGARITIFFVIFIYSRLS
jgi:hypothetical protein